MWFSTRQTAALILGKLAPHSKIPVLGGSLTCPHGYSSSLAQGELLVGSSGPYSHVRCLHMRKGPSPQQPTSSASQRTPLDTCDHLGTTGVDSTGNTADTGSETTANTTQ